MFKFHMYFHLYLLIIACIGFIACDDDQMNDHRKSSVEQLDQNIAKPTIDMLSEPVPNELPIQRPSRRMSLKQLAQSIPTLTKGIRWTEDFGQGEVDLLNLLAPTFGAPDYLIVTEENLEPNLLIAKFMSDASKRICQKLVDRELRLNRDWQALGLDIGSMQETDWQSARVKLITDQQVLVRGDFLYLDENYVQDQIQRLMGLFLGDSGIGRDHPRFEHYWSMFQLIRDSMEPQQLAYWGYFSICVGLFTDPGFLLY
jgi:hypothetical protein